MNDPIKAVDILRKNLPPKTTILRVIPILEVRSVKVLDVKEAVEKLLKSMSEGTFAIRLDGYLEDENGDLMKRRDSIELIARDIDRKVNLKNPDVLVYIKTVKLGRRWVSAIYVGNPSNIISTVKMYRNEAKP